MSTRPTQPRPDTSYFCSLCGVATDNSHFDEGAGLADRNCSECGDACCVSHRPAFRIYCAGCCGGSSQPIRTVDELRVLRTNPYLVGCDACLNRIEGTLRDAPLPVYLAHYLHSKGMDIDVAIEKALSLCG